MRWVVLSSKLDFSPPSPSWFVSWEGERDATKKEKPIWRWVLRTCFSLSFSCNLWLRSWWDGGYSQRASTSVWCSFGQQPQVLSPHNWGEALSIHPPILPPFLESAENFTSWPLLSPLLLSACFSCLWYLSSAVLQASLPKISHTHSGCLVGCESKDSQVHESPLRKKKSKRDAGLEDLLSFEVF